MWREPARSSTTRGLINRRADETVCPWLRSYTSGVPDETAAVPQQKTRDSKGEAPRRAAAPALPSARRQRKLHARKVTRVVRHIEPWSVLKAALVLFFCLWVIFLITGLMLWKVASESGLIDNIETFIADIFAYREFTLEGRALFRAYAIGGLFMVLASTVFATLSAMLFNLISDLVGGIRMTVIQEETARTGD